MVNGIGGSSGSGLSEIVKSEFNRQSQAPRQARSESEEGADKEDDAVRVSISREGESSSSRLSGFSRTNAPAGSSSVDVGGGSDEELPPVEEEG